MLLSLPSALARPSGGGPGFVEHHGPNGEVDVNVCSYAVAAGAAHCDARVRTDDRAKNARPAHNGKATPNAIGNNGAYDPSYLQSAYDVASAAAARGGGAGQIVAIVDAYDDPNVASDLASYRSFFNLSPCPSGTVSSAATGCVFQKVNQSGGTSHPPANAGWATEIALDVEMVSAICQKCQILLVEANTNAYTDLGASVNEAVALGANVVSNSYGGGEFNGEQTLATSYYRHPGIAVTVSSGDSGYGVQFPAASPDVTAVGGTSLTQLTNAGTRNGSETAWSGAGSGCSVYEPKPTWQHDGGCAARAVADVSAVANPSTGVWVYDTYGNSGWAIYGGTSVAAPIVGAYYGLAGNSNSSTTLASYAYGSPGALYDVTSGSNGGCSPLYLCNAGNGYDGPTGLGTPGVTPNSLAAFGPPPAAQPPAITSFAPSSGPAGTSVAIKGTGFTGATAVSFNGVTAAFAVGSDTSISATVPAGASTGPISVTNAQGTATTQSGFTVTTVESDVAVAYQINVAHSGLQTDAALAPPFARRWQVSFANPTSYPLIAGGKVFVTVANSPSSGSTLYALSQASGSTLWSQPVPGTYAFSAAAYDAGRLFVVNSDGVLRAFDAASGSQAWSTQLTPQYLFTSPPTAANGVVYVTGSGSGGTLYAVDEMTGGLIATQGLNVGDHSSPALSDSSVFVGFACNWDYGFAKTTLASLWSHSTGCSGGGGKTTVYANGRVYTRDASSGNLVLDATSGAQLATFAASPAPAVDSNTLFALAAGTLSAQALTGGSTKWTFVGDGGLDTAPILLTTPSGEFVIVGSSTGTLYALDASSGQSVWSTNVGAGFVAPDEQNAFQLTGLGAGQGVLVVPAGNTLAAYDGVLAASAPAKLTATAGNAQVSLSWSASNGTAPITYNVWRGTASGGETQLVTGLSSTSYFDTGLKNGTTYYYEVTATNPAGTSGFSNETSATPSAGATVPGAPTALVATRSNKVGVSLSWNAPASNGGATISSYTLFRSTSAGAEVSLGSVVCSTSSCGYTDTTTKRGARYFYQVAAVNSVGPGPRSNEASAQGG
jgi:outer membrane protein assembly factor BamB